MVTQYSAQSLRDEARLLEALGKRVSAARKERQLSRRAFAEEAGVSERFLLMLEQGDGNISVVRLHRMARTLGTTAAKLLEVPAERPRVLSLLGLRGAGKSTVGAHVAKAMGVPFVELDRVVAEEAGLTLSMIFEVHGEGYFRKREHDVLIRLLATSEPYVLATGGSIVTAKETYALLRKRTQTVWLRARAEDHWNRVIAQGDLRPMAKRKGAERELHTLLAKRRALYSMADHTVDTHGLSVDEVAGRVIACIGET